MSLQDLQKFILRTPLLKLTDLLENEEELLNAYKNPLISQALLLASQDLYIQLLRLQNNEISDQAEKDKILLGLYKYHARMCIRATPFGYFSGINVGHFSKNTNIILSDEISPRFRLDMDFLCNLYYKLIEDSSLNHKLTFYPNSTLYKTDGQWRYVEYLFENDPPLHNLVSIDDNEVLSALIDTSAEGKTINELVELIVSFGFDKHESEQYLNESISSQVFISNLYPSISGTEYQYRLFSELEKIDPVRFKNMGLSVSEILSGNKNIQEKIEALKIYFGPFNLKINSNYLIQVDLLKKPVSCELPITIKNKIEDVSRMLLSLSLANNGSPVLEVFKIAFYERYEDCFMPLSFVMDTDLGIGYRTAVSLMKPPAGPPVSKNEKTIKALKLKLYTDAVKFNLKKIELKEEELKFFGITSAQTLPTLYAFAGNIYEDKERGVNLRYRTVNGVSALNSIGRFGHLDKEIEKLCKDLVLEDEKNYEQVINAEIVHIPQGRIGNVISRPHYRHYEIPYLGFVDLPIEQQIAVDDLYIGVVNGRAILFSKKHNKEIIPRLSNAHNFPFDSLPLYHLLCDLQGQDKTLQIAWSWGELVEADFLPRVEYKNVIVTPARWNIRTSGFKPLLKKFDQQQFSALIKELNLVNEFLIVQADNELYINLSFEIGIKTFLSFCKKYDTLNVEEFLFTKQNTSSGYTNEILIPSVSKSLLPYQGFRNPQMNVLKAQVFGPMSEWIFLKIYTGKKYVQKLLVEILPSLVEKLKKKNIISKWFFIRYEDPKNHLRLRFLLTDIKKRDVLLKTINKHLDPYLKNNNVWDMQIATYKREMERYGGAANIEESESVFYHNSEMVLSLIPLIKSIEKPKQVLYVIYCVDYFLNLFDYIIEEKTRLAEEQSLIYNKEFGVDIDKELRTSLSNDFRKYQRDLAAIISFNYHSNDVLFKIHNVCEGNKAATEQIISAIKINLSKNANRNNVIASYIHMFINRLFSFNQRSKEMIMYFYITKYYKSVAFQKNTEVTLID